MQCNVLIQIRKYSKLRHSGIGKRPILFLKIYNRGGGDVCVGGGGGGGGGELIGTREYKPNCLKLVIVSISDSVSDEGRYLLEDTLQNQMIRKLNLV